MRNFPGAKPKSLSRIQLERLIGGEFSTVGLTGIRSSGSTQLAKRKGEGGKETFIATVKTSDGRTARFVADSWHGLAVKVGLLK